MQSVDVSPQALMPLDKHCTPIHNLGKEVKPVRVITFDCSYAQEMQRKAELLLVYAAQLQNRALLANLKKDLKTDAAVEYLSRAEKLRDVDELQQMLNETKNGSELKECQDEEIKQLETGLDTLLRAQKLLHHDRPHINRIKAIYPEWLAEIERFMQQNGSVQEYLKAYEERIEDVDKALQKEGEILALALQDTAFSNLSTTDKIVAGSLLDYVKTLTFEITGDELSTSEKVKRGLLTVSASSLAAAGAYTAATVILANPVTAASVVTLAGAGAVLYNGTKYVYNKTSSYFSPLK
ncbi:MAG: hypothetical protein LLG04_11810 [Parachlamydia sp.]|nr:hypothetical protein [Parachlamydia sp.]